MADPNSPTEALNRQFRKAGLVENAITFPKTDHQDTTYGTVIRIDEYKFDLAAATDGASPIGVSDIVGHIFLPLPNQIQENLSNQYGNPDLNNILLGAEIMDSMLGQQTAAAQKTFESAAIRFGRNLVSKLSSDAGGAINAFTGSVPNPFSVAVYERTSPRIHTFDWKLIPMSAEDSLEIKKLVNTLRYYSLPDVSDAFLKFPNVFNIAFAGTDQLFGMSRCFLRDMSVNYTPNNNHSFFGGTYAPTAVQLTCTFQEIEPLTKNSFRTGPQAPVVFGGAG